MADMNGLRRRKFVDTMSEQKIAVHKIAALDVFPKVPSDFKKSTSCGALLTIICCALMMFMVFTEYMHYRMPNLEFSYSVDGDFSSKLPLSVDLTVAMPCEAIGADIVDLVNDNIDIDGGLNEEPAYFELNDADAHAFHIRRSMNNYVTEEYHAIHRLIWTTGYRSSFSVPVARKLVLHPTKNPDACRFYGLVHLNKMAGNFHVLSGKSLHGANIHAHISLFSSEKDTNFSHRIDRLAFGNSDVAILNPLDGELKIAQKHSVNYQYNLKVVPTSVQTRAASVMTYQYGVQSMERILNHSGGSHGTPGIFIKYDINPLKINVMEAPVPILHFLVRVCGVIGGIFATTGIISSLINYVLQKLSGRLSNRRIPLYRQDSKSAQPSSPAVVLPNNALFSHLSADETDLRIQTF